jgi:hypothetical protein
MLQKLRCFLLYIAIVLNDDGFFYRFNHQSSFLSLITRIMIALTRLDPGVLTAASL